MLADEPPSITPITSRATAPFASGPPNSHHTIPNAGVYNTTSKNRSVIHTVPSEHIQYKGPLHAIPYETHNVLTPAFQNVIANWLKAPRGI
jgi:hypothetical protein